MGDPHAGDPRARDEIQVIPLGTFSAGPFFTMLKWFIHKLPVRFEYEEITDEDSPSWGLVADTTLGFVSLYHWYLLFWELRAGPKLIMQVVSSGPYNTYKHWSSMLRCAVSSGPYNTCLDGQSSYHVMNKIPPCDISAGLSTDTILTLDLNSGFFDFPVLSGR